MRLPDLIPSSQILLRQALRRGRTGLAISLLALLLVTPAWAQNNSTLTINTISNASGAFTFPATDGTNNLLIITATGVLIDTTGTLGNNFPANNNRAVVGEAGALWTNSSTLTIGNLGSRNTLVVTNGGVVVSAAGTIGGGSTGNFNYGRDNSVVVADSGSIWTNSGRLIVGNIGAGNSLIISNGATVYSGSGTMGNSSSSSTPSTNNFILITGSGSLWNLGSGFLGIGAGSFSGASANNLLTISEGATVIAGALTNGGTTGGQRIHILSGGNLTSDFSIVGDLAAAGNNLVVVSDTGSVWTVTGTLRVGNFSSNNRLIITNGAMVSSTSSGNTQIGMNSGGNAANGRNNSVLVSDPGSVFTNVGGIVIGFNGAGNSLVVSNGAKAYSSSALFGSANNVAQTASNNFAIVTGAGSLWQVNGPLGMGAFGFSQNSRLTIEDGGQLVAASVTNGLASSGGQVRVTSGGLLEANILVAGTPAGNTISNVGGIYQFTTATPTITPNGAGRISVTDGTVSFRGVGAAPVTALANLTYAGENTLRLNNSSNATGLASYTFNSGLGATNYVRLELVGVGALWRSGQLTVGSSGGLLASNTTGRVHATVTNLGTITVVHSHLTWASNVVIQGRYSSDPSTNVFLENLTVTESGALAGGVGDLFDFKKNLFIHSTNRLDFQLQQSAVMFSGGGMHTNAVTGSDLGGAVNAWDAAFTLGTNFAYGELRLGSAADQICFQCGNLPPVASNALYVGWLDLLGDTNLVANLHAPANINLYYDVQDSRNAYLGGMSFQLTDCDLSTPGGLLLPVIPEPGSVALFWLAAAMAPWLRRHLPIR